MPIDSEYMKLHLPHYLTTENRDTLIKNLESIRDGGSAKYLIGTHRDPFMEEMLQGDGWRGFQKFNFTLAKSAPYVASSYRTHAT